MVSPTPPSITSSCREEDRENEDKNKSNSASHESHLLVIDLRQPGNSLHTVLVIQHRLDKI
jgi:hypothetical protein